MFAPSETTEREREAPGARQQMTPSKSDCGHTGTSQLSVTTDADGIPLLSPLVVGASQPSTSTNDSQPSNTIASYAARPSTSTQPLTPHSRQHKHNRQNPLSHQHPQLKILQLSNPVFKISL